MLGSFWTDFNLVPSTIDEVLKNPDCSLEDLLREDDVIQECKHMNIELIDILSRRENILKLVNYVIMPPDPSSKPSKFPYVSSEIFCCEVASILDALTDDEDVLRTFLSFLDRSPPLDPGASAYFVKVLQNLLDNRTNKILSALQRDHALSRLIQHIDLFSVLNVVISLWTEVPAKTSIDVVSWLLEEGLVPALMQRLNPTFDTLPNARIHSARAVLSLIERAKAFLTSPPSDLEPSSSKTSLPSVNSNSEMGALLSVHAAPVALVDLSRLVAQIEGPLTVASSSASPDVPSNGVQLLLFVSLSADQPSAFRQLAVGILATLMELHPSPIAVAIQRAETAERALQEKQFKEQRAAREGVSATDNEDEEDELTGFARSLGLSVSNARASSRLHDIVNNPDNPYSFSDEVDDSKSADGAKLTVDGGSGGLQSDSHSDPLRSPSSMTSSDWTPPRDISQESFPAQLRPILVALPSFVKFLSSAQSPSLAMQNGTQVLPVGELRLKTIELILSLVRSCHAEAHEQLVASGVISIIIDLFFMYEWNNFLHRQVELLVTRALQSGSVSLLRCLIFDCRLLQRLMDADRRNAQAISLKRGSRLGYMAFIVRIANLLQAPPLVSSPVSPADPPKSPLESSSSESHPVRTYISEYLDAPGNEELKDAWSAFLSGTVNKANTEQKIQLGGGAIQRLGSSSALDSELAAWMGSYPDGGNRGYADNFTTVFAEMAEMPESNAYLQTYPDSFALDDDVTARFDRDEASHSSVEIVHDESNPDADPFSSLAVETLRKSQSSPAGARLDPVSAASGTAASAAPSADEPSSQFAGFDDFDADFDSVKTD